MSNKTFIALLSLIVTSLFLSGCNILQPEEDTNDIVYPPGIITPTPQVSEEVDEENSDDNQTPTPSLSPVASPSIMPSDTPSPSPTNNVEEGNYRININSASISTTDSGIEVKAEGEYTDNCTVGKYSWEIKGNQVVIEVGKPDDTVNDCQEASKPYSGTIPINYSFRADTEYTVLINGFESQPFQREA